MKEWLEFLEKQKQKLGPDAINQWGEGLKVVNFDAGNLYLEANNPLQISWFEEYLRPAIKMGLRARSGRPIRVFLSLAGASAAKKLWQPQVHLGPDPVFSACSFDSFFPGEKNLTSLQLLKEALEQKSFSPIYLQGPQGVGKTHLLMAASQFLSAQGLRPFYVKADRFTEHIVAAIRSGSMIQLRKLYRDHSALLIDDVETLSNRSASQEELFHTFNAFHLAGKPILLSGKHLPSHMTAVEPRLTSRFEWGLVLSFSPLSEKDRADYCQNRLLRKGIVLEKEELSFFLSLFDSIALINRAMDVLEIRVKEAKPTVLQLKTWLSSLIQEQERRAFTAETLLKAVSAHFDILLTDLQGKSQHQEHTTPRQIAMYLCRTQLHLPYMKIGALFSRDHSTVMTSVKLIEKKAQEAGSTKDAITEILKTV